MREALALIRAHWLSRISYRLRTAMSLASLLASVVPLFFIAGALQPVMAEPIRGEADHYFGFVLVGTLTMIGVNVAINALPGAIGGGIQRGTLEALLATPARLPALLMGLIGADLLWAALRMLVLLAAGWILGVDMELDALLPALGILLLILLAYIPVGLLGAALVLVYRTTGPLPTAVASLSVLLGGVYYPTHVIPSWIHYLSDAVPLTYGLRALRRILLEGAPLDSVAYDVLVLASLVAGLFALSLLAFRAAFRYAKRSGTLSQY